MFGRRTLQIVLSIAVATGTAATATATDSRPPNIVLVYADDLGWRDTGHTGSDFYQTPHIDRLASSGMTFSDAYSAAAVCSPSRAALLSGQYPARLGFYGILDWLAPRQSMRVQPVFGEPSYRTDDLTVADALRARGYTTGIIGKWQLGK